MAAEPPTAHLLAGDVGGTKTNLAIFSVRAGKLLLERNHRFHSADYPGLNAILREFLEGHAAGLHAAGFGVPGPVNKGRGKLTNLTWGVDAAEISSEFDIAHVEVINDLAANACGISQLVPGDFAVLQTGAPDAAGNRCVISPGTGLGQAGLYWDGSRHRVWACEGGHADFAPRNDIEIALLEYLIKRYGHVSCERVASGIGIENIYEFLRDSGRGRELPEVARQIREGDPGPVISHWAESNECPMCAQALDIFAACLGAEAGNMALKAMATGGVFLGGGIPGKMLSRLRGAGFLNAFNDKGRLSPVMQAMPVKVVLNDQAALFGAARYAFDHAT